MSTDTIALLAPFAIAIIGLLAPVLLHVRSKRELRLERDTRALSAAQDAIHTALEERGLERRVERISTQLDAAADDRRRLEKEISMLRELLPREFVLREDWIKAQGRFERKLDSVGEMMHSVLSRLPPTSS